MEKAAALQPTGSLGWGESCTDLVKASAGHCCKRVFAEEGDASICIMKVTMENDMMASSFLWALAREFVVCFLSV